MTLSYSLILSFSLQCKLNHLFKDDSFSGYLRSFFFTAWAAFKYMLEHSCVSLAGALLLLIAAITFVPSKVSRKKRVMIGVLHVSVHLTAALILMLLMELGVETCIRHKLLATSGQPSYFRLYVCFFGYLAAIHTSKVVCHRCRPGSVCAQFCPILSYYGEVSICWLWWNFLLRNLLWLSLFSTHHTSPLILLEIGYLVTGRARYAL